MTHPSRNNTNRAPNFRYGSETAPKFNLRVTAELHDKVIDASKENHRSITAEICSRLEKSFRNETGWIPQEGMMVEYVDDQGGNQIGLIGRFEANAGFIEAVCLSVFNNLPTRRSLSDIKPHRRQ